MKKTKKNSVRHFLSKLGYVRDLKTRLLGKAGCLISLEYNDVEKAFGKAYAIVNPSDSEYTFIEQPGFTKWWAGKPSLSGKHKDAIDLVYPDLFNKWFNRERYTSRLQLYLASQELLTSINLCDCSKERNNESEISSGHCDKCTYSVIQEAKNILTSIHYDWKPTKTGHSKYMDFCISGPKERVGVNVFENNSFKESSSNFHEKFEDDIREKVDYNLDLGETSFLGLRVPNEICNVYDDENIFSVCNLLLLLLVLNLKCDVEYRDDLILDFLTAINCATLIYLNEHNWSIASDKGSNGNRVQSLFINFNEYLFDEDEKSKGNTKRKVKPKNKNLRKRDLDNDPLFTALHFFKNDKCNQLSNEAIVLISEKLKLNENEINTLLELLSESIFNKEKEEYISKGRDNPLSYFDHAISDAKYRYFEIMKIFGLSENILKREFKSISLAPFDRGVTIISGAWVKPSPYHNS